MIRIPFVMVEQQVDAMYDFSITEPDKIDKRCLDIQEFIENCGWNLDDYIREMMGHSGAQDN